MRRYLRYLLRSYHTGKRGMDCLITFASSLLFHKPESMLKLSNRLHKMQNYFQPWLDKTERLICKGLPRVTVLRDL